MIHSRLASITRRTFGALALGSLLTAALPLTAAAEIGEPETYPLKFRFRYFQDLSGVITLPPGFAPQTVEVVARRRGAKTADLSRTFAWMVAEEADKEFRS